MGRWPAWLLAAGGLALLAAWWFMSAGPDAPPPAPARVAIAPLPRPPAEGGGEPSASPPAASPPTATAPADAPPEGESHRDFPRSIRAGHMAGAWTELRKTLMASPSEADQALSGDIYALVLDLREHRRSPDEASWQALKARMDVLSERLRAGPHGEEPFVVNGLQRVEQLAGEVR